VFRHKINRWINQIWYSQTPLKKRYYPLLTFSTLYRVLFCLDQLRSATHFSVPIIVVGNITVGGTGKTPLIAWLADFLQKQGFKPGIVSRGYGSKSIKYPHTIRENNIATEVGDEALMLFFQTQCPVVIDPNRVRAVNKLLDDFNCNIILSDDGLQHKSLGRHLEIIVIDGERRFGNGHCLPLGPLREPVKRLKRADFIICNGVAHDGEFQMELQGGHLIQLTSQKSISISEIQNKKIHAAAGIGNPERFFLQLEKNDLQITRHVFPDHYKYKTHDFKFLATDEIVLMTEKDAVKCRLFADDRFFYFPVKAQLPSAFIEKFSDSLNSILKVSNLVDN